MKKFQILNSKDNIFFVGGGTGGHIFPGIAISENIEPEKIIFICSKGDLDKEILSNSGFKFIPIFSGKIRRYFDLRNFLDLFLFIFGFFQSIFLILKHKPKKIICFGGFVSLPMGLGGFLLKKKIFSYELDEITGISNKILGFFGAEKIFAKEIGYPLRKNIFLANKDSGKKIILENFSGKKIENKKILLAMGSSQGAKQINDLIKENFEKIKEKYFVILLTGIGKKIELEDESFVQFEFLHSKEYFDILSFSDFVVSRGSSGSLAEILFFKKISLIIPLDSSSKDHQRKNAKNLFKKNLCLYLDPLEVENEYFLDLLIKNSEKIEEIQKNLKKLEQKNSSFEIAKKLVF